MRAKRVFIFFQKKRTDLSSARRIKKYEKKWNIKRCCHIHKRRFFFSDFIFRIFRRVAEKEKKMDKKLKRREVCW